MESTVNGVIIKNRKGLIKYSTPAFLRMFKYEFPKVVKDECG